MSEAQLRDVIAGLELLEADTAYADIRRRIAAHETARAQAQDNGVPCSNWGARELYARMQSFELRDSSIRARYDAAARR